MAPLLTFGQAVGRIKEGEPAISIAEQLLNQLTPPEALSLLDGDLPFYEGIEAFKFGYNFIPLPHGTLPRYQIPGILFSDGPRGATIGSGTTIFPVSTARGATWDVKLEEAVGLAIGREVRAKGCNFFAGVCINLPRHPAWGRIQETYSEDPLLLGEFGAALTRGAGKNVMTCVKHYAANSMENARFQVDVKIEEEALMEVYLPHFKRVVEEGVSSVMSSYNSVNGEWAGQNRVLLTEILRGLWGFRGFVMSDFIFGLRDSVRSLKNGLDVEAPFAQQRAVHLPAALENGSITMADVHIAGKRVLATQLNYYASRDEKEPDPTLVFGKEHRALARTVAARSMVLLQNNLIGNKPLLPLSRESSSVAVIGRLANAANTGDRGSSHIRNDAVVTPFQGISATLPKSDVILEDSDEVDEAVAAAKKAEIAVVIVGYNAGDEGEFLLPAFDQNPEVLKLVPPRKSQGGFAGSNENTVAEADAREYKKLERGGDRTSLRLRPRDIEIIKSVSDVNPRTVVVIITAGAVIMEEWRESVHAILFSWYSGSEGGHALADVLFGAVNVSGRLPYSIPTNEEHLPFFESDAKSIIYDRWFGQRLLDRLGVKAAFPLGFGLSYTSFSLSDLHLMTPPSDETIILNVTVTNTGDREGRQIVQVYGKPVDVDEGFPAQVLIGFAPVDVESGESKIVEVRASTRPLQRWEAANFKLASRRVIIEAGGYAGDPLALKEEVDLTSSASCHL